MLANHVSIRAIYLLLSRMHTSLLNEMQGNPGTAITREFYDEARRLTVKSGAQLWILKQRALFTCFVFNTMPLAFFV